MYMGRAEKNTTGELNKISIPINSQNPFLVTWRKCNQTGTKVTDGRYDRSYVNNEADQETPNRI